MSPTPPLHRSIRQRLGQALQGVASMICAPLMRFARTGSAARDAGIDTVTSAPRDKLRSAWQARRPV